MWSPYEACNGTFTANIDHRFSSIESDDLGIRFVFFDFAGSGLVHVVGESSLTSARVCCLCIGDFRFSHVLQVL